MGTHALFWGCTNVTKGESKCPKSSADQGCSDLVAGEAVSCPQSRDSSSLRGAEGMWGQEGFCEQEVTLSFGAGLSPSLPACEAAEADMSPAWAVQVSEQYYLVEDQPVCRELD